MSLGERIKIIRKSNSLSQKIFAEKIGVKQSTLSCYENGISLPSIDVLIRIAFVFDVSIDWLCELTNNVNDTASISSFGDIFRFLFRLDTLDGLRYEIDIENLFSSEDTQPGEDICASVKFYGNDSQHPDNAMLCSLLRQFSAERSAFEGAPSLKKAYAVWKAFLLEDLDQYALTGKRDSDAC